MIIENNFNNFKQKKKLLFPNYKMNKIKKIGKLSKNLRIKEYNFNR